MTASLADFDPRHFPVLVNEVVEALAPADGEVFVDGTFGAGGYSRAVLASANCVVWAIDRDPNVIAKAEEMSGQFPDRFHLLQGCFSEMKELLAQEDICQVDGVALDIGVSSMQLDEAERGFSFMHDGPLDMRMGGDVPSAADVVNDMEEEDLANIIYRYGEEHKSRRIARAITEARQETPITRTRQLADIVSRAVGQKRAPRGKKQIHPATRTFQALRIYVNDELGELERGLEAAEQILSPGGRLCVVTFHSLEDRIVKNFFRERSGETARASRHMPMAQDGEDEPTFEMIFRGGKKPSREEIELNARSRSAKLRAGRRTAAPAREREKAA